MTNLPVGFTWKIVSSSSMPASATGRITCSMICSLISARTSASSDYPWTSGSCGVEITTVWMRAGLSPSYSTVT